MRTKINRERFIENMRRTMDAAGIKSLRELNERCDLGQGTIKSVVCQKRIPNAVTLYVIAEACKASMDDFMVGVVEEDA